MKKIKGGVTSAKGFTVASTAAGIKYENREDMALLYSKKPCHVAGTFTSNVVKAAPVLWDRRIIREEKRDVHAVVVNTGIANAGTGKRGYMCCEKTAAKVAELLGIDENEVLVGSTGVIGPLLDMDKIYKGIEEMVPRLSDSIEAADKASCAIMTTDTHPKQSAVEFEISGVKVTLGGMSKGSGMIHPNMCTMLGYITTDACISSELLQKALSEDVVDTFNMISVDGDTSTNDTLILMANGEAGNPEIREDTNDYYTFKEALNTVTKDLARMMAADGEGASKLMTCNVVNAPDMFRARVLAKSVITSSLVKAAVFGNDANWGRILCAMGYSGVDFDPENIDLSIEAEGYDRMLIYSHGETADFSEEEATNILKQDEVIITADMKNGDCDATAWGCDLTYDYVKINADYRS